MNKRQKKKIIDKLLAKAGKEMSEDASRLAQINDDGTINRLAEVLANFNPRTHEECDCEL